jgi:hypothetical protein
MLPFITAATSFLDRMLNRKEGESAKNVRGLLKRHFNPDHTNVERDTKHSLDELRTESGPNDDFRKGEVQASGLDKPVRWIQYLWRGPKALADSSWHDVTWRFYENGLIMFHAEMTNSSGRIDLGDVQGHRIELRTTDGALIGAWKSGFFVRRNNAVHNFTSYFKEDHPLLALHFDELAEQQTGILYHGGERDQD